MASGNSWLHPFDNPFSQRSLRGRVESWRRTWNTSSGPSEENQAMAGQAEIPTARAKASNGALIKFFKIQVAECDGWKLWKLLRRNVVRWRWQCRRCASRCRLWLTTRYSPAPLICYVRRNINCLGMCRGATLSSPCACYLVSPPCAWPRWVPMKKGTAYHSLPLIVIVERPCATRKFASLTASFRSPDSLSLHGRCQ